MGELSRKKKDAPGIEAENKVTALRNLRAKYFTLIFNYAAMMEKYGHSDGKIREMKKMISKTIHDRCWFVDAIKPSRLHRPPCLIQRSF